MTGPPPPHSPGGGHWAVSFGAVTIKAAVDVRLYKSFDGYALSSLEFIARVGVSGSEAHLSVEL